MKKPKYIMGVDLAKPGFNEFSVLIVARIEDGSIVIEDTSRLPKYTDNLQFQRDFQAQVEIYAKKYQPLEDLNGNLIKPKNGQTS